MKVLHIVSSIDPKAGGVTQAIKSMIRGLDDLHKVTNEVVCLNSPDSYFLDDLPFKVYALGPAKTPWQYSPLISKWLNENLLKYDVVIVHGLWQYHTFASYTAFNSLKGVRPKLFVMPHGMLDPYFQRAKGRRLKAIRNWFFWKFIEQKLINSATGMLFTCEAEMNLAEQTFTPYHPKAKHVVGLGVEPAPVYKPAMKTSFEEKAGNVPAGYILFLGRIDEKKGVDLLVRGYLKLLEENRNLPSLVIAGPGLDSDFGADITSLVNNNEKILFPGMLRGDAKWGAFYGAGAFVLPSHQENFGIAVVEALACGIPVLISNQVNIWKEIEDGQAGIVDEDNDQGTYRILKNWFEKSDKEKKDMRIFAKATFYERFEIENAAICLFEAIK